MAHDPRAFSIDNQKEGLILKALRNKHVGDIIVALDTMDPVALFFMLHPNKFEEKFGVSFAEVYDHHEKKVESRFDNAMPTTPSPRASRENLLDGDELRRERAEKNDKRARNVRQRKSIYRNLLSKDVLPVPEE